MAQYRMFLTGAVAWALWTPALADAQATGGAERFQVVCSPCHTIGGGVRVGPDLKGVTDRRTEEWLYRFIPSPQKMIGSGDPVAVQLQQKFNNIVMPDPAVSRDEIAAILMYIKTGGDGAAQAPAANRASTPADVRTGQDLFQGKLRFANGGPACNSCHHVKNDAVIGGGVLAKELTTVFSRMGAPGLHAILGKPPFPVMEQAFRDRELTESEVFALVSFLKDADEHEAFQPPRDYGFKLFYSGIGGLALLLALIGVLGRGRKKHSVNAKIFERQVKTR